MSEAPKLSQVIRLDSLPLNQTYFTPEGYLMDRPILTSTGIFEYTLTGASGGSFGSLRKSSLLRVLPRIRASPSSSRMMRVWWIRTTSRSIRSAPS